MALSRFSPLHPSDHHAANLDVPRMVFPYLKNMYLFLAIRNVYRQTDDACTATGTRLLQPSRQLDEAMEPRETEPLTGKVP